MKKGFVLVDIPDNCKECPLSTNLYGLIRGELICCNVAPDRVNGFRIKEEVCGKPDWCPIREMPKKRNEHDERDECGYYRAEGWNSCIDELERV